MENTTNKTLCYSFIAVPTNLFFALDNNLRNALTVLLQLSSVFADADGYFFRTNEDLQEDFKMGKNLTIAVLESLYQYGLLQVKSVGFTKKKGKKQVNFYRVNFEAFKKYEDYHIYTITKNEELHLNTVDYKAKDFKVSYTAATDTTVETTNDVILEPTDASNGIVEETPSKEIENAPTALEMSNSERLIAELGVKPEIAKQAEEPKDVLAAIFGDEYDVAVAEEPIEHVKVDDEMIETASVIPSSFNRIEKRNTKADAVVVNEDQAAKEKCEQLVKRYEQMTIPTSNEAVTKCNEACKYIYTQFANKLINAETKNRLTKAVISARFEKFSL